MDMRQYLSGVAKQLIHEIEPVLDIKSLTTNSDLLGSYAEACVRRLAERVVKPMRVSTGAVLDYPVPPSLRQLDVIIWAPFPAPAVFEVEDFALVPRSSAFGVLEIKRSNYSSADSELEKFIESPGPVVGEPDPSISGDDLRSVLGVITVMENRPSAKLQSLIESRKVVALLEKDEDKVSVRGRDVLVLVNFLQYVSWRYRIRGAQAWVPQVNVASLEESDPT